MNFAEMLIFFLGLIHTLIRFLPFGIYFFAYFSTVIYKDLRTAILLIGLVLNDLIGHMYKTHMGANKTQPATCSIFNKEEDSSDLGFLPNSNTQIISFVSSFYFSDMYYKEKMDIIPFIALLTMIFLTVWSRLSIDCETPKDIVYNIIFGIIYGVLFYYFVKKYYLNAEKGIIEKETCDLGYNNYKCSEIRNGTVIMKQSENNDPEDNDE